jgi:hypothetical protein
MPDNFRRGSSGDGQDEDAGNSWPGCGARDLPPTGRDQSVMFWESIGMNPGDDWRTTAHEPGGRGGSDARDADEPGEAQERRGRGGSDARDAFGPGEANEPGVRGGSGGEGSGGV